MKQNEKDLLRNPPEKVVLMYQAVCNMINEGCDINNMKVVDITSRAGIGKGTAYEYFASKEEIIIRALLFEMIGYLEAISEITYSQDSFEQKAYQLMDFGIAHFYEGRTFLQIMKVILGAFDISDAMKQEFHVIHEQNICSQFSVLQDAIIDAGVKEGVLKQTNLMQQRLVFNSQMIAFTMCLLEHVKKEHAEDSLEDIKRYVYGNVVKLLS